MLGNCATGRLRIVMVPTITMTIEITIATMGRLIKNFDIGLPSLAFRGKRLGVHLHALTHLLHTFGNHPIASLQPVRNNPIGTDAVADLNCADAYSVLAIHHCYLIPALQLRHRTLRDEERVFLDALSCPNSAVTAGAQNISRIRK